MQMKQQSNCEPDLLIIYHTSITQLTQRGRADKALVGLSNIHRVSPPQYCGQRRLIRSRAGWGQASSTRPARDEAVGLPPATPVQLSRQPARRSVGPIQPEQRRPAQRQRPTQLPLPLAAAPLPIMVASHQGRFHMHSGKQNGLTVQASSRRSI